ncbi:tetratricopeptide repeat protein [Baaleninema sp.]|uniref:O-linked N-acetylglucosamine transferase, SPINDLY family protein n=1 Tax=Baaleninema sp. TaxID=3101197 RepID=UPI003D00D572
MDDRLFRTWLSQLNDSETADLSSGLKFAVASLELGETYCQVGVEDGEFLVSALSEAPETLAYAVDDFAETEDAEAAFQAFANRVMAAGLEERVTFCSQDMAAFFLELRQLETEDRIGVYVYNGSIDYRSILLGLLFPRPLLSDSALLVVRWRRDTDGVSRGCQAIADFLASHPQAAWNADFSSDAFAVLLWDADSTETDLAGIERWRDAETLRELHRLGTSEVSAVERLFETAVRDYERGDYDAAERGYREVLTRQPDKIEAWFNLGMLYYVCDRPQTALDTLHRCLELDEHRANVYYGLGLVSEKLAQRDRAIAAYRRAIELDSQFIDAYTNLGNIYYQDLDYSQAETIYRQALQKQLPHFGLYLNLANALMMQNRLNEAIYFYEKASEIKPEDERLKDNLKRARLQKQLELPVLYESPEQIEEYRIRFKESLEERVKRTILTDSETKQTILFGIGWHVNFYLAYQGKNDREFQEKYGQFVHKILSANYPEWVEPKPMPPRSANGKLRIGYVSYFMKISSISKLSLGWLKHADREGFELYSYHLGRQEDAVSKRFKKYSDRFQQFDDAKVEDIAQQILKDDLHILVFIDIGMYPKSTLLAAMRLAPVQCTTWCHPVTSGLPTVEYFLSCELMEPENAEEHYSERLILLPNIGVSYEKPNVSPPQKNRKDFQLDESAIVYLSCQSLYKYLPQYDYIFAEIARRVPEAQFAFLSHEEEAITDLFRRRLDRAFSKVGLAVDRFCKILPRLDQVSYWNLNQVSDIYLDTLSWSGGNTTLEAIACDLPIVTCPGEFMRGRHSYAILKMLGIPETIATTEAEYIDIAVRLGLDANWRQEIVAKTRQYRDRVYEDTTCIDALEQFYREVFESKIREDGNGEQ